MLKPATNNCVKASPAAMNDDVTGRYCGHNPASEERYAIVRKWIDECSTHQKCNETVSGSASIDAYRTSLPTRCVEISKDGRMVYLRETEGTRGPYITLTHRWNQETERCKMTRNNYRELLEGLEVEELPRLFQDVFLIATKLGVRYVWIDSLCILQSGDNGADWRREAPKMVQYYQFSLLTIAGTLPNMENGLLAPNSANDHPWASKLVRLPYRNKANAQAGFFYVYRRKARLTDDYWGSVRNNTLFRRGWVLQEWLLSKRLLLYTPLGLIYECHSDIPRTDGQERIEPEGRKPDVRSSLQLKASFHWTNASILDFWYHAVEAYSGCHLTKPDHDRILALAGVAKEVGQILINPRRDAAMDEEVNNEMYLSGLWLYDIHHGLLWQEDPSSEPWTVRVHEAPSWSWASLMAKVRWPERMQGVEGMFRVTGICLRRRERHERPEYMVVGKKVFKRLDDDSPGETAMGLPRVLFDPTNMYSCMHIRGKLQTVHVRGYLETEENLYTAALSTAYDTGLTSRRWRAICSPRRPETIAGWGSLEQLRQEHGTCADFGVAVHALHVSTRHLRSGGVFKRADPVLDVLFLEEVERADGVYRRLGVGRIADGHLIEEFCRSEDRAIQLL
jgi:Heterokaryon incompatibility protein (HET)